MTVLQIEDDDIAEDDSSVEANFAVAAHIRNL